VLNNSRYYIFPFPSLSVNEAYGYAQRGRHKRGGGRYLLPHSVEYRASVIKCMEIYDAYWDSVGAIDLKSHISDTRDLLDDNNLSTLRLYMSFEWMCPKYYRRASKSRKGTRGLYYQTGRPYRFDWDNGIKFLQDSVYEYLNIGDEYIEVGICGKSEIPEDSRYYVNPTKDPGFWIGYGWSFVGISTTLEDSLNLYQWVHSSYRYIDTFMRNFPDLQREIDILNNRGTP